MLQLDNLKSKKDSSGKHLIEEGSDKQTHLMLRKLVYQWRKVWMHRWIYFLMMPGILFFLIFAYVPMWGVLIAFKEYRFWAGFLNSPWVGFANFEAFFNSPYLIRLLKNTLIISSLDLLFVLPAPILLSILLNEVRSKSFKRVVQTVSYLPHFISWVVVGGLVIHVFSTNIGILNSILRSLNLAPLEVIGKTSAFIPLVIGTSIWKSIGWGAIIYLAAIAGINPELYEAAMVDGANRFQRILNITLPGIMPVIIIMLIFRVGDILNVNFLQIMILMGSDASLYAVGDVIQTYVYRVSFFENNMSLGTAVGLFQGVIGLILIWLANKAANRLSETGLW